jgi:hypothetical protein
MTARLWILDKLVGAMRRSQFAALVSVLLTVLAVGEPSNLMYFAAGQLFSPATNQSRSSGSEEEISETGKLAASANLARRFLRRKVSPSNHVRFAAVPHGSSLSLSSGQLTPITHPVSELRYRNGVGAPLRC